MSRNGNRIDGEVIILDATVSESHPEWRGFMHVGVLVSMHDYAKAPFATGDRLAMICETEAKDVAR